MRPAGAIPSAGTVPYVSGAWLFGVSRDLGKRPIQLMESLFAANGPVVKVRIFGKTHFYLLSDPEDIHHVLAVNSANYTKSPHPFFELLSHVMGKGLVTSDGDLWRRQRRIIQPAFTKQTITNYVTIMTDATRRMCHRWEDRENQDFRIDTELMRLTLDIVGHTLFGMDITGDAAVVGRSFTEVSSRFTKLLSHPLGPAVLKFPFIGDVRRLNHSIRSLDSVINGVIDARRSSTAPHDDLLDILISAQDPQSGIGMDNVQLRDELMTLLLSGHETTADALTWALYLIAGNPDVRARLEAEVDRVLGDRVPTLDDLGSLSYTKMVIQETLRLYPPIFMLARWATHDDEIAGFFVPGGSIITICPYLVHRDPAYWDSPDLFDPDRFAPGKNQDVSHAYIPFSAGPRQCVGIHFAMMEAQLILAMTVQRYRLDLLGSDAVVPEPAMTLRPEGGLTLRLNARHR